MGRFSLRNSLFGRRKEEEEEEEETSSIEKESITTSGNNDKEEKQSASSSKSKSTSQRFSSLVELQPETISLTFYRDPMEVVPLGLFLTKETHTSPTTIVDEIATKEEGQCLLTNDLPIQPGDVLERINHQNCHGLDLETVVGMCKLTKGLTTLHFKRNNTLQQHQQSTIQQAIVILPPTNTDNIDDVDSLLGMEFENFTSNIWIRGISESGWLAGSCLCEGQFVLALGNTICGENDKEDNLKELLQTQYESERWISIKTYGPPKTLESKDGKPKETKKKKVEGKKNPSRQSSNTTKPKTKTKKKEAMFTTVVEQLEKQQKGAQRRNALLKTALDQLRILRQEHETLTKASKQKIRKFKKQNKDLKQQKLKQQVEIEAQRTEIAVQNSEIIALKQQKPSLVESPTKTKTTKQKKKNIAKKEQCPKVEDDSWLIEMQQSLKNIHESLEQAVQRKDEKKTNDKDEEQAVAIERILHNLEVVIQNPLSRSSKTASMNDSILTASTLSYVSSVGC